MTDRPKSKVANLADVAKYCGLSPSTVSHIVSRRKGLRYSKTTHEKVLAACKTLGYIADSRARSLRIKRNLLIGVYTGHAFYEFGQQTYQAMIGGILQACNETDYEVIMFGIYPESTHRLLNAVRSNRIDGALIFNSMMVSKNDLTELRSYDTPIEILEAAGVAEGLVRINEQAAMAEIIAYLIKMGHKKIAYVDSENNPLCRVNTFEHAIKSTNIQAETFILPNLGKSRSCADAVAKSQQQAEPPSAYIIGYPSGDINAQVTINVLTREYDYTIPQDISIVGWDGLPIADIMELTTVAKPFQKMGSIGFQKLIAKIENPKKELLQTVLEPEFIIRKSSGQCP